MSSYFCCSKVHMGLSRYMLREPHKVEIKLHTSPNSSQGSGKKSCSKFMLLVGRINFFGVVRQIFSFSCWLAARLGSQFLEAVCVSHHVPTCPPSPSSQQGRLNLSCTLNLTSFSDQPERSL